jgi:hypothetical protein
LPVAAGSSAGSGGSGQAAAGGVAGVKRPRQRRRWTQIGNVFCDEMTGWVHMCDETCRCEELPRLMFFHSHA